ncbi:MAG: peptidoglycan editing factor PgeF [Anaerolineae bacterium]
MPLQRVEDSDTGITWYHFLDPHPSGDRDTDSLKGFRHAMVTRLGGVSQAPFATLNLGSSVGDDPVAVEENHRRLFAALGLSRAAVVSPHQVHGAHVVTVDRRDGGSAIPATDALVTDQPSVALLLRFADCVPVLFYDAAHHAVGLAHAGWRGVAAQVVRATVAHMAAAFGTDPGDLWAGIGPSICSDHYAVGDAVVDAVQATLPTGTQVAFRQADQWTLDLPGAIHAQLTALGVRAIDHAGICTACRTDEWYSHRAEEGRTGRFGALIVLEA